MEIYFEHMAAIDQDMLLLKAADLDADTSTKFSDDLEWKKYVNANLNIFEIAGDHLGIHIHPGVTQVAKIIKTHMLRGKVIYSHLATHCNYLIEERVLNFMGITCSNI